MVEIDTIGPLRKTNSTNMYIVTTICNLSKYLVTIPVPDKSANTIAKAIYENHVLIFGPMKVMKTDVCSEYTNSVIRKLCEFMKTDHRTSTAYHHQTVGTIERSHSNLNAYIRAYLLEMADDCYDVLV